ncbi:MAG: dipeptide epimerase, partial [Gammaproteobacteria bacterium]
MKITGIQYGLLKVPLKTPFKTALRTVENIEDAVIIIETDTGHLGYGSAPATAVITGETHGSIIEAIRTAIMPRIMGQDVSNLNQVVDRIQRSIYKNTSAKAAVEVALYDLFAQQMGEPLYRVLGGGDPVLSTDITISVDHIQKMVDDSLAAIERGFDTLKIKVGKDINLDVERVKAVFAAVNDKAVLRLDANQGWTPKQTVAALRDLEASGVQLEFIEQPVKGDDIEGMKYVTERVATPVMADESTFGPKEVIDLIKLRAADIINIKLMKTGGISNAIKIADTAATYDMECMIGCMLECGISVTAAAHLAVAKSNSITKVDLDSPSLCTFNPVDGGALFDNSEIKLQEKPGLGIDGIEGVAPYK